MRDAKLRFMLLAVGVVLVWMLIAAGTVKPNERRYAPGSAAAGRRVWSAPIDLYPDSEGDAAATHRHRPHHHHRRRDEPLTGHTGRDAHASHHAGVQQTVDDDPDLEADAEVAHPLRQKGSGVVVAAGGGASVDVEALINAPPIDWSDTSLLDACPHKFTDAELNMQYVAKFKKIFTRLNTHWWLDEGGLIGAARAGGMSNADDDFDFFALLPNQVHPCTPDSHGCTKEQFNKMIHAFLLEFWNDGMCINNFDPDYSKFDSKSKLMYSLMLNRNRVYQPHATTPGARCFEHGRTPRFAHMHLAMLTDGGKLATNVWAKPSSMGGHPHDLIPVEIVLPVTRCRTGGIEAACPQNIPLFLKMRNEGEYNKSSAQGNCLLVRKKWSQTRKDTVIQQTRNLHSCGYNSMHDLIEPAIASNYMQC